MAPVTIVLNPEKRYIDEIINTIVREEKWGKTRDEYHIRTRSLEVHYFFVAIDTKLDKPIGCIEISMDRASSEGNGNLWYIGNFFISEPYRNLGLGRELFNLALRKGSRLFNQDRAQVPDINQDNFTLNALMLLVNFYSERFGFRLAGHSNCQVKLETTKIKIKGTERSEDCRIVDVEDVDFEKIAEYDRKFSGRERGKYLKEWMYWEDTVAQIAADSCGNILGFICARPQIQGNLAVGPFYADNYEVAEALLHCILKKTDPSTYPEIWFRFPSTNTEAPRLLQSIYPEKIDVSPRTQCLFTKKLIKPDCHKVFSAFEGAQSFI